MVYYVLYVYQIGAESQDVLLNRIAVFSTTVKTAAKTIVDELEGVIGIVLYGSVARGDADRRSDIDLWVLVAENRMKNQQRATRIRQELEEEEFGEGRYAYEIDVEALQAIPKYTTELREILSDGIVIHKTEEFETVKQMIFHGDNDE